MKENIIEKVELLSPLPKTIIEIEEFRKKQDPDTDELLKIIQKDALIVSTLLKISNSAMFGFRSKVETVKRALELLGIDFTISIAISTAINNILKCDLSAYFINTDDFMKASNLSSCLSNLWASSYSFELKEQLALPSLLQETGKFIIAEIVDSNGDSEEFKTLLRKTKNIEAVEKKFVGMSTSEVTAAVFRHWNLSDSLISLIEHVDNVKMCKNPTLIQKVKMLNVIKTVCNITNPLSEKSIEKGIERAKEFELDYKSLQRAIVKLQDRLLDE